MRPHDGCVWITGASSGIGAAVARRLAEDGWQVAASARNAEKLADLAAASAGRIVAYPLDVTNVVAARTVVSRIEEETAPIARAILNAGTFVPTEIEQFTADHFREHVEINLMGTVNCLEPLLPRLCERRKGQIAVVSSVAGYRGLPRAAAYGSTKAALINLTESLKLGLDKYGVKVQVVNPGFVKTPLTDKNDFPMPFLMDVEDAAAALVRGLDRTAFEISFPKKFTFWMKRLRSLPYGLYFPAIHKSTGL